MGCVLHSVSVAGESRLGTRPVGRPGSPPDVARELASARPAKANRSERGAAPMLDLYTWPTPNGHKVHILLEELGARLQRGPHRHLSRREQFSPEFLRISPNNKMPALVDHDGPDGAPILDLRVRGDSPLPRREASSVPAAGRAQALGRHAVADVPDERRRSVPRPGPPLPGLRAGEDRVRDRPLHERGRPHLRRAGRTARGQGLPRGRVLGGGHGHVTWLRPPRAPGDSRSPTSPTWSDGFRAMERRPQSSAACRCSRTGAGPVP